MSSTNEETQPKPNNASLDADKALAKSGEGLLLALSTRGLISSDGKVFICPVCSEQLPASKFGRFEEGNFKDYKNGCWGDSISILLDENWDQHTSFPTAVRYLAGKAVKVPFTKPDVLPDLSLAKFRAKFDPEVYHGIMVYGKRTGAVDAAVEFYSKWHIGEQVVRQSGAIYITNPQQFSEKILEKWSAERLVNSGLFTIGTTGEPRCLISDDYPVVEPHHHPDGQVVYMQFRCSDAQYAAYQKHKAGKGPYVPKCLSLRGADSKTQLGVNLPAIAAAAEGTEVRIVEGFKDRLAAGTFGLLAYGIPGAQFRPGQLAISALRGKRVRVCLDGDQAGIKATEPLVQYLIKNGIDTIATPLPTDRDVTDLLVESYANKGCNCRICKKWRMEH